MSQLTLQVIPRGSVADRVQTPTLLAQQAVSNVFRGANLVPLITGNLVSATMCDGRTAVVDVIEGRDSVSGAIRILGFESSRPTLESETTHPTVIDLCEKLRGIVGSSQR